MMNWEILGRKVSHNGGEVGIIGGIVNNVEL
jgi:hypothetical protein